MSLVIPTPSLQLTQLEGDCWIRRDPDGTPHAVDLGALTRRDRFRLLDALRRNAVFLQRNERRLIAAYHDSGVIGRTEYEQRLTHLRATPAHRWLEEQPLVERLRDFITADGDTP